GVAVPYAIQLDFAHDADVDNGGAGRAYVVNPRGDIKNVTWRKLSGSAFRVIVIPAQGEALAEFVAFKFYVAGGITGLAVNIPTVAGYDINGNDVPGLIATVN
ncbi:MAG: hypothetical protein JRJ14_10735, partial [Deltaproteobacteria bacterium]|nr:hypothetical protein [Deltaproteobacteria bacterium]